jgi:hypothetical protein
MTKKLKLSAKLSDLQSIATDLGFKISIELNPSSKFRARGFNKTRAFAILHGFELQSNETNSSTTVDLLLYDAEMQPSAFVIYMTESDSEEYTWNIEEAINIVRNFAANQFKIEHVGMFKRTQMLPLLVCLQSYSPLMAWMNIKVMYRFI